MVLVCPHCTRTIEISGSPPSFCAYCGSRLQYDPTIVPTEAILPGSHGDASDLGSDTIAFVPGAHNSQATATPTQVAGYRLLRILGGGGMGTVYEAVDLGSERHVALKLIAAEYVRSREAVERFRQEGKLASSIEHPRCVFVLAADEYEGRPYIVMELMPGATLQDLVVSRGPLPIDEAVARILDVIDGLRQAHRQGVVHRDVKPSNCFLDDEDRVKVGDFGLAKALTVDAHLTRTGAFVGTPLYASPEQIKGDEVDVRTDVYSVAASLYFLLTGRPPFREKDATATIARIVSESPPTLRSLRPDIPPALEAAVLRGLDRDRDRRWRDLDRMRRALRPFLPSRLSIAGLGLRVAAFLIDLALFLLLYVLVFGALAGIVSVPYAASLFDYRSPWLGIVSNGIWVLYFGVMEGLWGASVGKWLTELRVHRSEGGMTAPGLLRGLGRALLFALFLGLADDILNLFPRARATALAAPVATIRRQVGFVTTSLVVHGLGLLAIVSTMRARTGYRGLHEWLSGTRVVTARPVARRRLPQPRRLSIDPTPSGERPPGMGESLGPYRLRGVLRWEHDRKILLAQDTGLERIVWIVLRPLECPPPTVSRQNLARATRPRWLTGGVYQCWRWDAYLAPSGCSLADLVGHRGLPWAEVRPILEDLVEELDATSHDGTLPDTLSVEQVWVQPDGRVLLVDALMPISDHPPQIAPEHRVFDLTLRVAAMALDGTHRRPGQHVTAIHSPVPQPAATILHRLLGNERPFDSVSELLAALQYDRILPTEVSRARRSAHLILQTALLLPGLVAMLWISFSWRLGTFLNLPAPVLYALWCAAFSWPIFWTVWAGLTRGGLTLRLAGMALVGSDNRPARRLTCGLRAFLVWAPILGLLVGSVVAHRLVPTMPLLGLFLWGTALVLVLLGPLIALIDPARGPHDRILRTALVPS